MSYSELPIDAVTCQAHVVKGSTLAATSINNGILQPTGTFSPTQISIFSPAPGSTPFTVTTSAATITSNNFVLERTSGIVSNLTNDAKGQFLTQNYVDGNAQWVSQYYQSDALGNFVDPSAGRTVGAIQWAITSSLFTKQIFAGIYFDYNSGGAVAPANTSSIRFQTFRNTTLADRMTISGPQKALYIAPCAINPTAPPPNANYYMYVDSADFNLKIRGSVTMLPTTLALK